MEYHRIGYLTVAGGWAELWADWGGSCVMTTDVPHDDVHMPVVRMGEEGV